MTREIIIAYLCRILYLISMIYCVNHATTTKEKIMIVILIMSVAFTTFFICKGIL